MKGRKPNITAPHGALDKAPPAPAWLPKFAKTEWARVVPALVEARSLAQHELSTVESYCLAIARIRECEAFIQKEAALAAPALAVLSRLRRSRRFSHSMIRRCVGDARAALT